MQGLRARPSSQGLSRNGAAGGRQASPSHGHQALPWGQAEAGPGSRPADEPGSAGPVAR